VCGGLAVVVVISAGQGRKRWAKDLNGPAFATGLFWESGSAHFTGHTIPIRFRKALWLAGALQSNAAAPCFDHFTGMYTILVLYCTCHYTALKPHPLMGAGASSQNST